MRNREINLPYACANLLLGWILFVPVVAGWAQTQVPATAPQVQEVLPSYEGQNVVSVEIAGRPDLDQQQLTSLLAQREGQPFSRAKIDESIAALKSSGQVKEVQLEVRPQADGVRVLLVCQPAIYFGIFNFPGAEGRFAYSRLLQVSDYPPRGAYSPVDIQNAQTLLTKFFQQNGYFEAEVKPEIQTDAAHEIGERGFPRQPQSSRQIWKSDSEGRSTGRGATTSEGLEVMGRSGSCIGDPRGETLFAPKNTECHSVS